MKTNATVKYKVFMALFKMGEKFHLASRVFKIEPNKNFSPG